MSVRYFVEQSVSELRQNNANLPVRMTGLFVAYMGIAVIPLIALTALHKEDVRGEDVTIVAAPIIVTFILSRVARYYRLSWSQLTPRGFAVVLPALLALECLFCSLVFYIADLDHLSKGTLVVALLGSTFAVFTGCLLMALKVLDMEHAKHPGLSWFLRIERFVHSFLDDLRPLEPPDNIAAEGRVFCKSQGHAMPMPSDVNSPPEADPVPYRELTHI